MSIEITAIIPNYNHARFLERRLKSVYGQTYPHLRVILLDDASTDNSREILEKYRNHPSTQNIVYNDINSASPFLQWQRGLNLAESDWVWIAESDDWCEAGFLKSLLPALTQPDCVMAYAQLNWANEAGNTIKPASPPEKAAWYDGKSFVKDYIFGWNRLQNAGMIVFRKSAAQQAAPNWKALKQAGDFRLWTEVATMGRVYGSGEILCYVTKHPESITAKHYFTIDAQLEIVDTWLWMVQSGSIRQNDLQKKLEQQLVNLLCIRKGLPSTIFLTRWEFWTGQLKRTGHPYRRWILEFRALWAKWQHYRKKNKPVA